MEHMRKVCAVFALVLGTFQHTVAVHGEDFYAEEPSHNLKYNAATKYPFQDPNLPWSTRIDDLVARLTLDEIVPQTNAAYPEANSPIPRLGIKPYVWDTECLHGQCDTNTTAFPQSIGLAASFR